jgi:hypothetical protein
MPFEMLPITPAALLSALRVRLAHMSATAQPDRDRSEQPPHARAGASRKVPLFFRTGI